MKDKIGINIDRPVRQVNHQDLQRDSDSRYASTCPECEDGVLLMRRDPDNQFRLENVDHCILCGQVYEYLDIDEVRQNDWLTGNKK